MSKSEELEKDDFLKKSSNGRKWFMINISENGYTLYVDQHGKFWSANPDTGDLLTVNGKLLGWILNFSYWITLTDGQEVNSITINGNLDNFIIPQNEMIKCYDDGLIYFKTYNAKNENFDIQITLIE